MNNTISISSAFLFGNPNFTSNQKKTKNLSNIRSGLNPLPFTEVEINKLNNILIKNGISTVSTNLYESTEQSLYENSKSDIIHLATHGFYIDGKSTDRFNWGLLASGSKEILQNDFKKTRRSGKNLPQNLSNRCPSPSFNMLSLNNGPFPWGLVITTQPRRIKLPCQSARILAHKVSSGQALSQSFTPI